MKELLQNPEYLLAIAVIEFLVALIFMGCLIYQGKTVGYLEKRIALYKDPITFVNIFHALGYQADTVQQFITQNDYLLGMLGNVNDETAQSLKTHIQEKVRRNLEFIEILEQRLDF